MRSSKRTRSQPATLLSVLAVWLLAMPSASVAAPEPAPQPLRDSVSGTATTLGFVNQVIRWQISATSGPSGETPTGTIVAEFNGPFFNGPVTCLSVQDNVALLKTQDALFRLVLSFRITDNAGLGVGDLV